MADRHAVKAKVIEAGDLEFKVFEEGVTMFGEGRWRRREFPRAMLIQFDSQSAIERAMRYGLVMIDRMLGDDQESPP